MKDKISAVITPITAGISTLKNGSKSAAASAMLLADSGVIKEGKKLVPTKYAVNPENNVKQYASPTVIPKSLPAPVPSSAIPAVTNPKIINGIIKPKKFPKIEVKVTNTLSSQTGAKLPRTRPNMIPMIILGIRPNLNFFLLPFD